MNNENNTKLLLKKLPYELKHYIYKYIPRTTCNYCKTTVYIFNNSKIILCSRKCVINYTIRSSLYNSVYLTTYSIVQINYLIINSLEFSLRVSIIVIALWYNIFMIAHHIISILFIIIISKLKV